MGGRVYVPLGSLCAAQSMLLGKDSRTNSNPAHGVNRNAAQRRVAQVAPATQTRSEQGLFMNHTEVGR